MLYYEKSNDELREYFLILCNNDYPEFIEKYLNAAPLKRIGEIGQFCGCDYSKIYNIKYFYSRLDHSVSCSLMTWHFTKDKTKAIMALFHDLGTPCFSHTIDYLLGDSKNQQSSEKNVFDIISSSNEITSLLKSDGITISDLKKAYTCGVVENERPKICVDRLDGILTTALVWLNFWNLDDIKYAYKDLSVFVNEFKEEEIGFNSKNVADYFFEAAYKYSLACQSAEDKYIMQFICDSLKVLVENNIITLNDLYVKKEKEIVNILEHSIDCFEIFKEAKKVEKTEKQPNCYYVDKDAKRRYVIPLCNYNGKNYRLNEISCNCMEKTKIYLNYKDSKYAYIPKIKEIKLKESD